MSTHSLTLTKEGQLNTPTWNETLSSIHGWAEKFLGCVNHHTSGVELRFPNDFQGDFCR